MRTTFTLARSSGTLVKSPALNAKESLMAKGVEMDKKNNKPKLSPKDKKEKKKAKAATK